MVVGPAQLVVGPDLLRVPKLVRCLAPGMRPGMFRDCGPQHFLHLQKTGRQVGMTGAVIAQIGRSWHQRQHATEQIHGCDLFTAAHQVYERAEPGFCSSQLDVAKLCGHDARPKALPAWKRLMLIGIGYHNEKGSLG